MYIGQCSKIMSYKMIKTVPMKCIILGPSLAAFFAESIQGVGGSVQFPKGYIKAAFDRTKELGGVCISDEVQTGFGRTGEHYWGFEGHGVSPDIVTMAKGISQGE